MLLAVLSPLAIFLVWTLLTFHGVPAMILPSPRAVAASFLDMIQRGYSGVSIWTHIGYSLWRVGVAFVLGSVLGIVIGLLRGRCRPSTRCSWCRPRSCGRSRRSG